mmetsp:Transcript_35720/g.100327  ORF Transcript_35720/g.100327 Transcript_35720/m.100327 type:complete len:203 (-) Transcript_35720:100-708(-)
MQAPVLGADHPDDGGYGQVRLRLAVGRGHPPRFPELGLLPDGALHGGPACLPAGDHSEGAVQAGYWGDEAGHAGAPQRQVHDRLRDAAERGAGARGLDQDLARRLGAQPEQRPPQRLVHRRLLGRRRLPRREQMPQDRCAGCQRRPRATHGLPQSFQGHEVRRGLRRQRRELRACEQTGGVAGAGRAEGSGLRRGSGLVLDV